MIESDRKKIEEIIKTAKELKNKVDEFCKKGACEWCPLDKIEDCNNYNQLVTMKYNEKLDIFIDGVNLKI